jgi:hypothetical protein
MKPSSGCNLEMALLITEKTTGLPHLQNYYLCYVVDLFSAGLHGLPPMEAHELY